MEVYGIEPHGSPINQDSAQGNAKGRSSVPSSKKKASKKTPWEPSQKCVTAIGEIQKLLEGLNPQERGHVVSRLASFYPVGRMRPKAMPKVSDKPSPPKKSDWKARWEQTPEYQAWTAFKAEKTKGKNPMSEADYVEYQRLQQIAFGIRQQIKEPSL